MSLYVNIMSVSWGLLSFRTWKNIWAFWIFLSGSGIQKTLSYCSFNLSAIYLGSCILCPSLLISGPIFDLVLLYFAAYLSKNLGFSFIVAIAFSSSCLRDEVNTFCIFFSTSWREFRSFLVFAWVIEVFSLFLILVLFLMSTRRSLGISFCVLLCSFISFFYFCLHTTYIRDIVLCLLAFGSYDL